MFSYRQEERIRDLIYHELHKNDFMNSFLDVLNAHALNQKIELQTTNWLNLNAASVLQRHMATEVQNFLNTTPLVTGVLNTHLIEVKKTVQQTATSVVDEIVKKHKHEPIMNALANQLRRENELNFQKEAQKIVDLEKRCDNLKLTTGFLATLLAGTIFFTLIK